MCKAFSAVVRFDGKVFWKVGIDGHEDIKKEFKLKDVPMSAACPNQYQLCPIEITPKDGNYLYPERKWVFNFDGQKPAWWKPKMEKDCWAAQKKWKKEVYSKINLKEAQNPINPLKVERMVENPTEEEIMLLKTWASVWDSVGASVGVSVRASVWNSVWDSVGDSVWDSVRASVWGSVGAYIGSLFALERNDWKYTSKLPAKPIYPFQSVVELWKRGLVPSFDGKTWRLHAGVNAKVVFEISAEELRKL